MSNMLGNNGGRMYAGLVKPVLVDCNFIVDSADANGLGVRNLKGALVKNVFMFTTQPPGTSGGITNPMGQVASTGFALVQLEENYQRYCGGFSQFASPTTGADLVINAAALTVGSPYIITFVGQTEPGAVTIAPVDDVAGDLASTWFSLYDAYGNTFIIWFSVDGVGSAPIGVSGTLVQQSISANDTAAVIAAALDLTIQNLPSGITGVTSFFAAGVPVLTVTSTKTNPSGPLPGPPADGAIPTGFAFAMTIFNTNVGNWQRVGLPKGVTPAVGESFIAISTGDSVNGGSTGLVKASGLAGVSSIEIIGDPSLELAPIPMGGSPNKGGFILVKFLAPTSAAVTTPIPTNPANGTIVYLNFLLETSSVMINGE